MDQIFWLEILSWTEIRILQQPSFWIMDGAFKTVPTLFRQLYTIHGRVGGNENSQIMPLVYALMSRKTEECYIKFWLILVLNMMFIFNHNLLNLFFEKSLHKF